MIARARMVAPISSEESGNELLRVAKIPLCIPHCGVELVSAWYRPTTSPLNGLTFKILAPRQCVQASKFAPVQPFPHPGKIIIFHRFSPTTYHKLFSQTNTLYASIALAHAIIFIQVLSFFSTLHMR
jgi:hypothetical protein